MNREDIILEVRKRSPDMDKPYTHSDLCYAIDLALEAGVEGFKEKIKDCIITTLTLDEIENILESVENHNISVEEGLDQFKIWSKFVKLKKFANSEDKSRSKKE